MRAILVFTLITNMNTYYYFVLSAGEKLCGLYGFGRESSSQILGKDLTGSKYAAITFSTSKNGLAAIKNILTIASLTANIPRRLINNLHKCK